MSKNFNSERYLPSHTLIEHDEILHLLVFILFNFPNFFFQTGDGLNFLNRYGMRMPEANVNLGPNIKQIPKKMKFSNKN